MMMKKDKVALDFITVYKKFKDRRRFKREKEEAGFSDHRSGNSNEKKKV